MRILKLVIGIVIILTMISVIFTISPESENKRAHVMEVKMLEERERKPVMRFEEYTEGLLIDEYLNNEPILEGAIAGISIRSASTGKLYYDNFGNTRFQPASNMKLLTGVTALTVLGENYTFSTEMLTDGHVEEGTLHGNLYIKGKGDPTLLQKDFVNFAQIVREAGIEEIEGNVIADDSWYDDIRLSRDLTWDDEHWYYGAQVSALTVSPNDDYDAGSVIVKVTPSEIGEKPNVEVTPDTEYITVQNSAKTGSSSDEEALEFNRIHGSNTFTINGTIPANSHSVVEWMAVWEPTKYALSLFTQALKDEGISWQGTTKIGTTSNDAEVFYTHESIPLSELIYPFMKLSNNGHAEVLIKELGKVVNDEGSWDKGIEVVEEILSEFEIDTEKFVIRDGSGISHINMLLPNEITKLLYTIQSKPWFHVFESSLPVAGDTDRFIGGTLRYRMPELQVQAKTGTITGVSTLSGYVHTDRGERLIFSIMLNNLLDEEDGMEVIDNLMKIIAENEK